MDAIRIIAERRIEEAIEDGLFHDLPQRGYIDCSLSGKRFFTQWFAGRRERERREAEEDDIPDEA